MSSKFTIDSSAVKPDDSVMFVGYFNDDPDILYGFDGVKIVDKDGEVFVEFEYTVTAKSGKKVEGDTDAKAQEILMEIINDSVESALEKANE